MHQILFNVNNSSKIVLDFFYKPVCLSLKSLLVEKIKVNIYNTLLY